MLARRVGQRAAARRACRYASSEAQGTRTGPHPHLLYVVGDAALRLRTMGSISSPLDALAMVRAVERRFGRVAACQFFRDHEIQSRYQFTAYISFWDSAAYSRVPKTFQTALHVKLPPENPSAAYGGPGLADLEPFLDPQDWVDNDLAAEVDAHFDEPETPADGSRILKFKVDHYVGRMHDSGASMPPKPPPVYNPHHMSLINNFIRWGGFAPKELLPRAPIITSSNLLFGGGAVDYPCMRNQLLVWHTRSQRHLETPPLVAPPANTQTPAPVAKARPAEQQPPVQQTTNTQTPTPVANVRPAEKQPPAQQTAVTDEIANEPTEPIISDLSEMSEIAPASPPPQTPAAEPRFPSLSKRQAPASPLPPVVEAQTNDKIPATLLSTPPPEPTPEQPLVAEIETAPAPSLSLPKTPQQSKSAKADSPKPAVIAKPPVTPVPTPVAIFTAERRSGARTARVVAQTQKVKPAPTPAEPAKAKAAPPAQKAQQPVASPDKKKKTKTKLTNDLPQKQGEKKGGKHPIEVEERESGIAARLKGMMKGWI